MKALEFESRVANKDQIELPPEVAQQIPEGSPVRVILLFDSGEDESWRQLGLERFGAGGGRAGSWRPQVTEVDGRSRIHHDGRELTSVVREFTDPERMAAQAAAQGIGHLQIGRAHV